MSKLVYSVLTLAAIAFVTMSVGCQSTGGGGYNGGGSDGHYGHNH